MLQDSSTQSEPKKKKKKTNTIESILFLFPTTAIRQGSEWGILHRVALKGWSVQPQDLLFTHRFCDHVPNFKNSRECLVFLRRLRFWDLFFPTDINPRHTQETTHTHTHTHRWNKLPPLGEQPLDEPGIPVYQMCQLVIFLTFHLTGLCLKRQMQQNQNWGTRMPNGAMKSDLWEPAERACLLLKHTHTFLFPRTRDGRRVAASRWRKRKKKHTPQS